MKNFYGIIVGSFVFVCCFFTLDTTAQVNADFTVDTTHGCNSLQVFFKDASLGTPATWFWDFGDGQTSIAQNPAIFYNSPGIYTVSLTVTGSGGSDRIIKSNFIEVDAAPEAQFSGTPQGGCLPLNVAFQDQSNAMSGYITNWTWDFGDGTSSTSQNPFHIYTADGIFTVTFTVQNSKGCSSTIVMPGAVSAGAKPVPSFFTNQLELCASVPVNFNNKTTGAVTAYFWDFGDGDTSTKKGPLHYFQDTGYMNVKLIAYNNACADSIELRKYVYIKPPIVKIRATYICDSPYQRFFQAKFLGQKSFIWDFGDGVTSNVPFPVHTYKNAGRYTVTLFAGADSCSYQDTLVIDIIDENISYSFQSNTNPSCKNQTVTFKASVDNPFNISSFTWDYGDGNISAAAASTVNFYKYRKSGTYYPKLITKDILGCSDTLSNNQSIKIYGPLASFIVDSVTCSNSIVNFADASSADGNSSITTWVWDYGDGTIDSLYSGPFLHTYRTNDTFNVTLKILDGNGCSDTIVKTSLVTISKPVAKLSIIDTLNCFTSPVLFFDQSQGQILGRRWFLGDGDTSAQTNFQHTYIQPGNYPVEIIIGRHPGCSDTAKSTIHVFPLPPVNAGIDTFLCYGQSLTLQPQGAAIYKWDPNPSLSCSNCNMPLAKPSADTKYYLTGTDNNGCIAKDSLFVEVKPVINLILNSLIDSVCAGSSLQLSAAGAEIYKWQPAGFLSSAAIANPVAKPPFTTVYTVIGTDNKNCFTDTAAITVQVINNPQFNITDTNISIPAGSSYIIKTTSSPDVIRWQWQPPAGLSCNDCAEPRVQGDKLIQYTGTAFNAFGCSATDKIKVIGLCDNQLIFIPNTFSPNGDNINDWFYLRGKGIFRIKSMIIFNRLGQAVFQRLNFAPGVATEGWNGTDYSKKLPSDVYIYYIEVMCNNGTVLTFKGDILLLL